MWPCCPGHSVWHGSAGGGQGRDLGRGGVRRRRGSSGLGMQQAMTCALVRGGCDMLFARVIGCEAMRRGCRGSHRLGLGHAAGDDV